MSLKSLHLLTLLLLLAGACTAAAMWIAAWFNGGGAGWLVAGGAAFAFGIAVILHGLDFFARSRELSWL